jgi:hypothetical protein
MFPMASRAVSIVVLLGLVVGGLVVLLHGTKCDQAKETATENAAARKPSAPPRLAAAAMQDPPEIDRDGPRQSHDAGGDASRPVMDEPTLMQMIRDSLTGNPRLAEALAREGRERFPDSAESDERDMLLVAALFNRRRIERAQVEAYYYYAHHPQGRYTEGLSRLTNTRPRPEKPRR